MECWDPDLGGMVKEGVPCSLDAIGEHDWNLQRWERMGLNRDSVLGTADPQPERTSVSVMSSSQMNHSLPPIGSHDECTLLGILDAEGEQDKAMYVIPHMWVRQGCCQDQKGWLCS